jgi:hypothetical protein
MIDVKMFESTGWEYQNPNHEHKFPVCFPKLGGPEKFEILKRFVNSFLGSKV